MDASSRSDSRAAPRAEPWALLALGLIGALLIRACVSAHPDVTPIGAVPVFDAAAATRAGNLRAITALRVLPPAADALQVLQALNGVVIDFSAGSAQVPESAVAALQQVAQVMAMRPAAEHYRLGGHSDGRESPLADLDLSRRQAQAVVDFLVLQGVSAERLLAYGEGDQKPLTAEPTEEARFRNRRIEFSMLP